MSPVSDISSSILSQLLAKNTASSTGKSQVSSQRPPPPPPPGGIISAVQKALSQMGLNSSSAISGTDSALTTSTDDASTAQKALYKFMHDLFTTMQDQSSRTSINTAYSPPMTTSIQDIIQTLGSSGTSDTNTSSNGNGPTTDLSNLQADFQRLVTAMGGDSTTGSSSTGLQTFLQNLQSNLNQQGSSSIYFINTTA